MSTHRGSISVAASATATFQLPVRAAVSPAFWCYGRRPPRATPRTRFRGATSSRPTSTRVRLRQPRRWLLGKHNGAWRHECRKRHSLQLVPCRRGNVAAGQRLLLLGKLGVVRNTAHYGALRSGTVYSPSSSGNVLSRSSASAHSIRRAAVERASQTRRLHQGNRGRVPRHGQ